MLVGSSRSPSRLGLSIPSCIEKEGNLSSLVPNGVCFGLDGLVLDRSSAYLG